MDKKPTGLLGSRLKTFKGQRDLSLGTPKASNASSSSTKKFVPNLNVERTKKDGNKPNLDSSNKSSTKKDFKGKTPARVKPGLIQTTNSVFSDGLTLEGGRKRGSGVPSYSSQSEKGFQSSRHATQMTKDEEERRIQALLRDDFIDDHVSDGFFVPVQLPMIKTGEVFRDDVKTSSKSCDIDDQIKSNDLMLKRKKQRAILDSDDDEDEIVPSKTIEKPAEAKELEFAELVKDQTGDLLFIQFPDHLPGLVKKVVDIVKQEPGEASDANLSTTSEDFKPSCTMLDLPEGYLGKIQIRKSGNTKLLIGNEYFDIDLGTPVGFLQDLVSVQINKQSPKDVGDMTVLGHIKNRVVISPDFENLFFNDQAMSLLDGNEVLESVKTEC